MNQISENSNSIGDADGDDDVTSDGTDDHRQDELLPRQKKKDLRKISFTQMKLPTTRTTDAKK